MHENVIQYIAIAMTVGVLVALRHVFFFLIPRKVAVERQLVKFNRAKIRIVHKKLFKEAGVLGKFFESCPGNVEQYGFRIETLKADVAEIRKKYSDLQKQPSSYYAGKSIFTLLRIRDLNRNMDELMADMRGVCKSIVFGIDVARLVKSQEEIQRYFSIKK